jgi:hypothetical protein
MLMLVKYSEDIWFGKGTASIQTIHDDICLQLYLLFILRREQRTRERETGGGGWGGEGGLWLCLHSRELLKLNQR